MLGFVCVVERVLWVRQASDEVVFVPAGHDDDDSAADGHQTGHRDVREPGPHLVSGRFRLRFVTVLDRVVDDQQVGTTACQGAASTYKHSLATLDCLKQFRRRRALAELATWKDLGEHRHLHDFTDSTSEIPRSIFVVCGKNSVPIRVFAHEPGRKTTRSQLGLAVTRRHRDDEPLDCPLLDFLECGRDYLVVLDRRVAGLLDVIRVVRVRQRHLGELKKAGPGPLQRQESLGGLNLTRVGLDGFFA